MRRVSDKTCRMIYLTIVWTTIIVIVMGYRQGILHRYLFTLFNFDEQFDNNALKNTQLVYSKRLNILQKQCENTKKSGFILKYSVKSSLIVDEKHRLLYCPIQKVGSTFWKRVLQILTKVSSAQNPFDIWPGEAHKGRLPILQYDSSKTDPGLLDSFTKAMFVREPYSRLFSAYINKVFMPNWHYFKLRRQIAEATRPHWPLEVFGCAPVVRFREFVSFVVGKLRNGQSLNPHFSPMHHQCAPCSFHYDVIGKMETFEADVMYILQTLNLTDKETKMLTFDNFSYERDLVVSPTGNIFRYRSLVEKCSPFSEALKYVWRHFQIRGILDTQFEMPKKFLTKDNNKTNEFFNEVLRASRLSNFESKKLNRLQALREAWATVSPEDLVDYQRFYQLDFRLFGYDLNISNLFWFVPKSDFTFLSIK